MQTHIPTSVKLLIFVPFVFVYFLLIDKGMVIVDPSSATTRRYFTFGLILLAYPLLAGGLLFFCLKNSRITKKANFWMACIVPVVNLVISFVSAISLLCKCEP
ncbi:MAG: hypothetical protein LBT24_02280, partial [Tannerella sp.]|nr:hypothetical protein [Tannerella sp.]